MGVDLLLLISKTQWFVVAYQPPLTVQLSRAGPVSWMSQYSPGLCPSFYMQTAFSVDWLVGGRGCKSALGLSDFWKSPSLGWSLLRTFGVFFLVQVGNRSFGSNLLPFFFKRPNVMLFRPTLLYLWFQNPKHSKTKKLS